MFSLYEQTAKLAHLNVRAEIHGEEHQGGADLKIKYTAGNDTLIEFHPALRSLLYRAEEAPANQAPIFEPGVNEALTVRRFGDLIETLRLKHALNGAEVVIGFGLGGPSDIVLDTADVDGFTVEVLEGGSVNCSFRVKSNPTSDQIKKLYEVLGGEITVSVTPAKDPQQNLLED